MDTKAAGRKGGKQTAKRGSEYMREIGKAWRLEERSAAEARMMCTCDDMQRTAGFYCEACIEKLEREVREVQWLARISTAGDTLE